MSLVFLKNDTNNVNVGANDHLKPYDWANYFDTPLVLPPDSQVAYISSTMQRDSVIEFNDPENVLWLQTGNSQMNLPMPIRIDTTQGAETWEQIVNQITANPYTGQTDFMWDGLSGGLTASYNSASNKIDIQLEQRLQPAVQGVWANRAQALGVWGGLNQTGMGVASGINAGVGTTNIIGGGASTLWDCGWSTCGLSAGGLPPGAPPEYGNNNYTMFTTLTGIKRSSDDIALTGLGGEVHFQGSCNAGAQGATANAESLPYIAGLNSVQCINAVEPIGADNSITTFTNECVLNGAGGSTDLALTPNLVQIRIDNMRVYVEILNSQQARDFSAIDPGSWGNCSSPPGADISPYGMKIVEDIDINTWLTTPLTQPQNTGGQASQPYFNRALVGATASRFNKLVFKIKWKSPNTFQVYMGTGYDETLGKYEGTVIAGGEQYPIGTPYQDTYSIIYDSQFGGNYTNALAPDPDKTFFVPSYFGDLGMTTWIDRRVDVDFRGNFDVINCYPTTPTGLYPSYDQMLRGINDINLSEVPFNYPNTHHLKAYEYEDIFPALQVADTNKFDDGTALATNAGYNNATPRLVCGKILTPATPTNFQRWFSIPTSDATVFKTFAPAPNAPDTRIGIVMGLIKSSDNGSLDFTLVSPNDLRKQLISGKEEVGETEEYNSVHIQLTNLPINGRNGMTSTKTATIAVVHNSLSTVTVGTQSRKLYNHYTNEKNWIDLNNVAEMTLNELRTYISNDANRPATYLVDKSDVVIMFRKRPESDTGVSRQVINKGGVYSSNGMTNR